ncbi:MAG TPA: hypothetical protein VJX66_30080 [Amycolatopsis sp.]|nr:hypothetical protein [Amycolatopsis sp.]
MHARFDGIAAVGAVEQVLEGSVAELPGAAAAASSEMGRRKGRDGDPVNQC